MSHEFTLWVTVKDYISLRYLSVQTQLRFADVALLSGRGASAVAWYDGKTPAEICVGSRRVVVPNLRRHPASSPQLHMSDTQSLASV